MANLNIELFNQKLKNPLLIASGIFGYGNEYEFVDYSNIGGFCTKGISLKSKNGNATPRIAETEAGMLNAVGLQNVGIDEFINSKIPDIKNTEPKIIANFFGNTDEEYIEVAQKLNDVKELFALEMNISCPNVKLGGITFGQDAKLIYELTSKVKKQISKPLIVKLTPNVTSVPDMAKAAQDAGADALSLINTVRGMKIDVNTGKPILANKIGGYSGTGIKPIAVRIVYECAETVKIPIIGIGGIYTAEDVIEFIMAGATAVQIGTAFFKNPDVCKNIVADLNTFMDARGIKDFKQIQGYALK